MELTNSDMQGMGLVLERVGDLGRVDTRFILNTRFGNPEAKTAHRVLPAFTRPASRPTSSRVRSSRGASPVELDERSSVAIELQKENTMVATQRYATYKRQYDSVKRSNPAVANRYADLANKYADAAGKPRLAKVSAKASTPAPQPKPENVAALNRYKEFKGKYEFNKKRKYFSHANVFARRANIEAKKVGQPLLKILQTTPLSEYLLFRGRYWWHKKNKNIAAANKNARLANIEAQKIGKPLLKMLSDGTPAVRTTTRPPAPSSTTKTRGAAPGELVASKKSPSTQVSTKATTKPKAKVSTKVSTTPGPKKKAASTMKAKKSTAVNTTQRASGAQAAQVTEQVSQPKQVEKPKDLTGRTVGIFSLSVPILGIINEAAKALNR